MTTLRVYFWLLFNLTPGSSSSPSSSSLFGEGKEVGITMVTGGEELVLNRGDSMQLGCRFIVSDMSHFNLFDNPISWRKVQLTEEFQINMMSNILEPFAHLLRFSVLYHFANFTHHFTLLVNNVSVEDSANYTCVIQGPRNSMLASTEHRVSVRDQVSRVDLSLDSKSSSLNLTMHQSLQSAFLPVQVTLTPSFEHKPQSNLEETAAKSSPSAFYFHENRIATGITCISYGGYPAPTMSVLLGSRNVTQHFLPISVKLQMQGDRGFRRFTFKSNLVSESLIIRSSDDGQPLTCQASVRGLDAVRVVKIIHVRYGPVIKCQNTLADLGEMNVHLRCEVKAKPEVTSLFWVVDVNKTAISGSRSEDEFWNLVRVKEDGSLNVQLHIKKVFERHFRNYVLVAENAISVQTRSVNLLQRPNQHLSSTLITTEKIWNFPKVQNYFLRHFARNVADSLIGSLIMFLVCGITILCNSHMNNYA